MNNICLLHTEYQKLIFRSLARQEKICLSDFVFFLCPGVKPLENLSCYEITGNVRGFEYSNARKLISEVRSLVNAKINGKFALWLASDDHPIGQILLNHKNRENVYLFEDGLGSYIDHRSYLMQGIVPTAAFIRNLLFLAPHYRAIKSVGSFNGAARRFALHPSAFPSKKNITLIDHNYFRSELAGGTLANLQEAETGRRSFIYLEQPMIEGRILDAQTYRQLTTDFIRSVADKEGSTSVLIRSHPRSDPNVFSSTLEFLKRNLTLQVNVYDSNKSFERILATTVCDEFTIASFFSSALYVAKIIEPRLRAYCADSDSVAKQRKDVKKYVKALSHLGVQPIRLN